MHLLITGSSGQIGTNVSLAAIKSACKVTGLDIRHNSWTNKIQTNLLDLRNAKVDDFPSADDIDLVLHFAANAKVYELVKNPAKALDNIKMTFSVLEYCRTYNLPIILASSREVYGDIRCHVTDEKSADFVIAESPYSASKIASEALVYSYLRCYNLPFLVFRFSNVFGRYDDDLTRMERVIPLFIDSVMDNKNIVVYGKDKILDFTYIDDCVDGVMRGVDALLSARVRNETFNLASGRGFSLENLVQIIFFACQKESAVIYRKPRNGEVTHYIANISKAKDILGYTPSYSLVEGIKASLPYYLRKQSSKN